MTYIHTGLGKKWQSVKNKQKNPQKQKNAAHFPFKIL